MRASLNGSPLEKKRGKTMVNLDIYHFLPMFNRKITILIGKSQFLLSGELTMDNYGLYLYIFHGIKNMLQGGAPLVS